MKRPGRFLATFFGVVVLLVVGGYFKMKHDLNRAVGVFANATQHVIGPSAKAAVAPVVVSPKDIAEPGVIGIRGALGLYPPGSEAADFNSKITDTWVSGMAAGKAVLETTKANQIQASALDIPEIPIQDENLRDYLLEARTIILKMITGAQRFELRRLIEVSRASYSARGLLGLSYAFRLARGNA